MGENFNTRVKCKYFSQTEDSVLVQSTFVSSSLLNCDAPSHWFWDPQEIRIALALEEFTIQEFMPFQLRSYSVYSIHPQIMSLFSGLITIFGKGFSQSESILCRVCNDQASKGVSLSDGVLVCSINCRSVGNFSVELSFNAVDYILLAAKVTVVDVTTECLALEFLPSSGPIRGGMNILIISNTTALVDTIVFKGIKSESISTVARGMVFQLPSSLVPGVCNVSIWVNKAECVKQFLYLSEVKVYSVSPTAGFTAGGDLIRLEGIGLHEDCLALTH